MKSKLPILICFGTRPEWLKVKPLVDIMKDNEYVLLFTGQHTDLLNEVGVDKRIHIFDTSNRLDSVISSCMLQFPEGDYSAVLVQGDTASAFGCAVAAFNRQIKILYMEAGLRSGNMKHPYPEEGYRQMISRISDFNFAPTELSEKNLYDENCHGITYITGNTILDSLVGYGEPTYGNKVLVTLHRRENHFWIDIWFDEINKLAIEHPELEFILPIHPNPAVQQYRSLLTNVKVIDPLNHSDLINILKDCKLVITDSGGLQEEGSFFDKKVIVCRKATERPEGIKTGHLYMCESPSKLKRLFTKVIKKPHISSPCPYGNGNAAQIIYDIIRNERF